MGQNERMDKLIRGPFPQPHPHPQALQLLLQSFWASLQIALIDGYKGAKEVQIAFVNFALTG